MGTMEIASKFNNFYLAQHKLEPNRKKKGHIKHKGAIRGDGLLEELFKKEFSVEELKEAIKNISNKKQPGHDEIQGRVK
jgi:hypothetical protein